MKETPMAFSMLKKAAATQAAAPATPVAPATPAPTPAPVPETPAPAPAPAPAAKVTKVVTAKTVAPAPATQAVATVAPASFAVKLATKNKVLAIVAAAESDSGGGFGEPIPALVLKGGDGGGTVSPAKGVPAEIASQLPQGKQPMLAQLLSYRLLAQSWPRSFDDRTDDDRPVIDCAIPPGDAELALAAMKGAENFQFCPRDQKDKWMLDEGGPGSLRPIMELLVYWPQVDDVVLLRTCALLKTVTTMAQSLASLCDGDGNLIQQPVLIEPVSTEWYDKHLYHYWKLTVQLNEAGKECHEKHAAWHEQVGETRPDLVATMMAWFSGEDKPVSDEHRALIMQAASMTNPRRARS